MWSHDADLLDPLHGQSFTLLQHMVEELVTLVPLGHGSCFPETLWLIEKIQAILQKSVPYAGFSPQGDAFNAKTRTDDALFFYEMLFDRSWQTW